MTAEASTPPDTWYESLPTVHAATGAVLRDGAGRWLLVRSAYRSTWTVPGGVVEAGEAPHVCVRRETREEVGIEAARVSLVAVDWFPAYGGRRRDLAYFLFTVAGVIRPEIVRVCSAEILDWTFADPTAALALVDGNLARCLESAITGTRSTLVSYVPGGEAV